MANICPKSPTDAGLPEQFSKWRSGQEEAVNNSLQAVKRVTAMCMPTGAGKSAIVVATARLSEVPTAIITNSRGLQDQYLCLGLGTKICSGDLKWLPIEDYKVGDVVLGFDEFRSPNRRMWRPSIVTRTKTILKPCYKLTMADGRVVVCSENHQWLVGKSEAHGLRWEQTCKLYTLGKSSRPSSLVRALDMWEYRQDFASGYLAAAFDGEGHLHQSHATSKGRSNGADVNLSFAQKDNPMLDEVKRLLTYCGYGFNGGNFSKRDDCARICLSGRREVLRFLGEIRPLRLLPKLDLDILGSVNPTFSVPILHKEFIGEQVVVALETSTHTFVAEGYLSHNSTFKNIGMADLRGRKNYICGLKPEENYTCEEGYNARCPYKGTVMCPSSQAEMRAATSNLVLTNYDKWTHSRRFGLGLNHIQQVIFDEGHEMASALERAMQVVLNHKEIEETLALDFPQGTDADDMHCWKPWAINARQMAEDLMTEARQKISGAADPKPAWVRHYTHMRNLARRLAILATAAAKDWVVEQVDRGYQFDPIRPGRYCESTLLLKVPKVVVVSATLRPKTLFMSGIGEKNFNFYEFASDFDPARCPIYWVPTMKVQGLQQDLSLLWLRLDQIIAKRQGRNGIVHTISYDRQRQVINTSRFADKMIVNMKGEAPTEMVEYFKSVPNSGTVLVSPSIGTGYDFAHDSCRWQLVCKIPFEPPSKILKARQEQDGEYTYYRAMQYLVQAFGRDMRDKSDWSERFICDDNMSWFIPRYGHLAPKSFHAVMRRANILPQPLRG